MHAIYTFININIGVLDDGERDLVKHVKTVKENACRYGKYKYFQTQ